ncbi:cytochrome P450 [Mycena rosella]|uniref:Cytochrome P450 n=1 Tax=Mycena rosella TaxID=1033263 RepID=A0AAD7CVI1_MYCRO|nr:cytochrome P450 [Mycena rosella]
MISQILIPVGVTLVCYGLFHVLQILYRDLTSPLRDMAGPKNPSLFFGNFKQMANNPQLVCEWRNEFGRNFLFKGVLSINELHTSDIKALNHIVSKSSVYQRAPANRDIFMRVVGRGVLAVEQDEHKRHNPAFNTAQIRLVTDVFVRKATQLRDIWAAQVAQGKIGSRIDVLSWFRRMTLDVIGEAGFNYQFDALQEKAQTNELEQVLTELVHSPHATHYAAFRLLQALMPILKLLPVPGSQILLAARTKMESIARGIVSESKATATAAAADEKPLSGSRDLLAMLLKSNMAKDIPESQRLTDTEVLAQIPTFFFAGHETTSSAASWALHALSLNIAAQKKLRDELLTMQTDNPTMDELNSLPYLEMVVRETMRVHAPALFTQRMAMEDDVLPLAQPYIDKEGISHDSLPMRKGQMIHIPILAVNTDPEIWGADAAEFKPERWNNVPDAASAIPGVWAHLFTFFAGHQHCIGFRFALVELKALLFTLVRAFEFEPAVPEGGIVRVNVGLIQRPSVLAEAGKGSGLPLIVKPIKASKLATGRIITLSSSKLIDSHGLLVFSLLNPCSYPRRLFNRIPQPT